jgi:hypothetical protein
MAKYLITTYPIKLKQQESKLLNKKQQNGTLREQNSSQLKKYEQESCPILLTKVLAQIDTKPDCSIA